MKLGKKNNDTHMYYLQHTQQFSADKESASDEGDPSFPGGQMVKNSPAMQETWVQYLGWEDPLEEGMTTHSSILAWSIPMDKGAWQATQSMGLQRIRHDWATKHSTTIF